MIVDLLDKAQIVHVVTDTVQTSNDDLGSISLIRGHHPEYGEVMVIHNIAGGSALVRDFN